MKTRKSNRSSYERIASILEKDHVVLEAMLLIRAEQGILRGHVLSELYGEKYELDTRILHSIYYWEWRSGGFLHSFAKHLRSSPRRISTAPRQWLRERLIDFLKECWRRALPYDVLFVW